MTPKRWISLSLAVTLLAGCGSSDDATTTAEAGESTTTSDPSSTTSTSLDESGEPVATLGPDMTPEGSTDPPVFEPGAIDPGLDAYVALAVDDLSSRLGVSPEDVEVVSSTVVVWSDAGLGCQVPGWAYAQVPQDGSLIELRVDGKLFHYHSGGSRTPFLCELTIDKAPRTGDPDVPPPGFTDSADS